MPRMREQSVLRGSCPMHDVHDCFLPARRGTLCSTSPRILASDILAIAIEKHVGEGVGASQKVS